jgi:putative hydrolase of the HAD superfamily
MKNINKIKVLAIDADDTLWDCQSHFEQAENQLYDLIRPYCDNPAAELYKTESGNMADLGYGCKAFTISIIETALRVGGSHIDHTQLAALLETCKGLLHLPATPLPGVEETLRKLHEDGQYTLVCFTKGELQDQENKLKRSGLLKYFDDVEITSDKGQKEFLALCEHQAIHPSELLMIGNSLKSDIAPALAIGAWAIHIPFHVTWQLEHFEDFDHERLIKIEHFVEVLKYIHMHQIVTN